MPHFIIDCSENILTETSPQKLMQVVHDTAEATGLFKPGDIKIRIRPFTHYYTGHAQKDFIHIFGNIMEGRTTEQKANLSTAIIRELKKMFPELGILSINIREFEKATYCNVNMVE